MAGVPKKIRQVQAFDPNALAEKIAFDDFDDSSKLMEQFTRKNRGIKKIFRQSDGSEENDAKNLSFEIRLESKSIVDTESQNDEENSKEPASEREHSVHIKNLPPVKIITLSEGEVNDTLPPVSRAKPHISLRRSLFKSIQPNRNILVCSTPVRKNNTTKNVPFFNDIGGNLFKTYEEKNDMSSVNKASPPSDEVQNEVVPVPDDQREMVVEKFASIATLEQELEKQYEKSDTSVNSRMSRRRSSGTHKRSIQELEKDEAEMMEIVPSQKSQHHRNRSSSSENKTNTNSVLMTETPVCGENRQHKSQTPAIDRELAIKLRRCDDTKDETDDKPEYEYAEVDKDSVPVNRLQVSKINGDGPRSTSSSLSFNSKDISSDENFEKIEMPKFISTSHVIEARIETAEVSLPPTQEPENHISTEIEPAHDLSFKHLQPKPSEEQALDAQQNIQQVEELVQSEQNQRPFRKTRNNALTSTQSQKSTNPVKSTRARPSQKAETAQTESENDRVEQVKKRTRKARSPSDTSSQNGRPADQIIKAKKVRKQFRNEREPQETTSKSESHTEQAINAECITRPSQDTSRELIVQSSQSQSTLQENFLKPFDKTERASETPILSSRNFTEESQDSSESPRRTVPPEVLKSFLSLRMTSSSTENENVKAPIESVKIKVPAKKRAPINSTAQSYIDLTNQKKAQKKKNTNAKKKRTLYSLNDSSTSLSGVASVAPSTTNNESPVLETENQSKKTVEAVGKKRRKVVKKQLKNPKNKSSRLQTSSSSENQEQQVTKSDDEGFDSETNKSVNDIRYDPYEQGCQRPGLRVRRFAKPYWIPNSSAAGYGITYGSYTKEQMLAEGKLKKSMKKNNVAQNTIFKTEIETFLKPSDKLKILEQRSKKTASSEETRKTKSKTKKNIIKKTHIQKDDDSFSATSVDSALTGIASLGSIIKSICNGNTSKTVATSAITCPGFDFSDIANLNLRDCGNGVYFGSYIEDKSDGIIKLIPGGFKSKSKSKNSSLKFLVVVGNVEIVVEGKQMKLGPMGYLCINPGRIYEIKNTSDQDVILYFTRFDKVVKV